MTEIKQIVSVGDDYTAQLAIFGLGDDSKVYVWEPLDTEWVLYKKSNDSDAPF